MNKSANNRKFKKTGFHLIVLSLDPHLSIALSIVFFPHQKMCVQLSRFQIFLTFSAYANTETFLMSFKKKNN